MGKNDGRNHDLTHMSIIANDHEKYALTVLHTKPIVCRATNSQQSTDARLTCFDLARSFLLSIVSCRVLKRCTRLKTHVYVSDTPFITTGFIGHIYIFE